MNLNPQEDVDGATAINRVGKNSRVIDQSCPEVRNDCTYSMIFLEFENQ